MKKIWVMFRLPRIKKLNCGTCMTKHILRNMYDETIETYITEHVLKSCLKICLIDLRTKKEKANYVIVNRCQILLYNVTFHMFLIKYRIYGKQMFIKFKCCFLSNLF
jgi:hypothetical protein